MVRSWMKIKNIRLISGCSIPYFFLFFFGFFTFFCCELLPLAICTFKNTYLHTNIAGF